MPNPLPHQHKHQPQAQIFYPPTSIKLITTPHIVQKARQFDVKVDETDPDSGSNPSDDISVDALEFGPGDDTLNELNSAISDLNDDEQWDLIALVWLGRGDFTLGEWDAARTAAQDIGRDKIQRYLAGIPLVSDYLEDGLSQFDETMADYLDRH
ncbi:MAG: DUF3775 domain-containing protein [Anaerolineaceae bacterium]|nr:DUF3775 domain-containing protein [Anaerolineaceae bacterium]